MNVADGNTIGGTTASARNIIVGSTIQGGILISDANDNIVQGNFIGTDVTGTVAVGNPAGGILINEGVNNIIGGISIGEGNIISGNTGGSQQQSVGIQIEKI